MCLMLNFSKEKTLFLCSQLCDIMRENKVIDKNSLNALAIDKPLEYARLALDGEM